MTGLCRAADAMLEGYLIVQSVAEGNRLNLRRQTDQYSRDGDLAMLFVGLANVAARLRAELAKERGETLDALDERLIGEFLIEGAAS